MNEDRPLEVHEEAALEAELGRLRRTHRAPVAGSATQDPLTRVVSALRSFDHIESGAIERHVDALYEEHAATTKSRGLFDFVVHKVERSTLAKILAASIVAHVLALPVLAYMLLTPKVDAPPIIHFEPLERFGAQATEEPKEELDLADAFNHVLLADRAKLAEFARLPRATPPAERALDPVEELLWQRLALWSSTESELAQSSTTAHATLIEWGAHDQPLANDSSARVADALRLELALDILASSPAGRAFVEQHVARRIAALGPLVSGADEAVADLVRAGLERASTYGLLVDTGIDRSGLDVAAWIALVRAARPLPLSAELIAAFERYGSALSDH